MISAETVEATWREFAALAPSRAQRKADETGRRQSELVVFVVASTDHLSPAAQSLGIYVFHVILATFQRASSRKIPPVKSGAIERRWAQNSDELERLAGAHPRFLEKAALRELSEETHVIAYMVEAIMEAGDHPDDPVELTEEEQGTLFLVLKTVIDVLQQQRLKGRGRQPAKR